MPEALPPLDDEWVPVPVSVLPLDVVVPAGFVPVDELLEAAVEEPCDELDCRVSLELLLASKMRTTRGRECRSRNTSAGRASCCDCKEIFMIIFFFRISSQAYLAAALGGLAVAGRVVSAAVEATFEAGIAAAQTGATCSPATSTSGRSQAPVAAAVGKVAQASCQPLVLDLVAAGQTGVLELRHREHVGAGVVGVEAPQLGLAHPSPSPSQVLVAVMGARRSSTCNQKRGVAHCASVR